MLGDGPPQRSTEAGWAGKDPNYPDVPCHGTGSRKGAASLRFLVAARILPQSFSQPAMVWAVSSKEREGERDPRNEGRKIQSPSTTAKIYGLGETVFRLQSFFGALTAAYDKGISSQSAANFVVSGRWRKGGSVLVPLPALARLFRRPRHGLAPTPPHPRRLDAHLPFHPPASHPSFLLPIPW